MMTPMHLTDDVRIAQMQELSAPEEILDEFPLSENASETVYQARQTIHRILEGEDDRLLVVVGPCSIHDVDAAREYAGKLLEQHLAFREDLCILMRVYFEKPRTTVGWKGLINDPNLDDSFEINKGLRMARGLLLDLAEMGLPAGTEYLDLISPQYVADLVSWGAVGARTTESQGHRELASGLSCPVGFKNGTDGNIQIAVDAVGAASNSHHFLSVTKGGQSAIFCTKGNEDCHIILRGGPHPNYDVASVDDAASLMEKAGLRPGIMVDTSHANSRKVAERQLYVAHDIAHQVAQGDGRIIGVMAESNLVAGNQKVIPGRQLVYGQSITDACMGWKDTLKLFHDLAEAVRQRRMHRA